MASVNRSVTALGAAPTCEKRCEKRCETRHEARRWTASLLLTIFLVGASASPALADDYDETMAGHPLRIIAYVLHPVGVAIDYLLLRPAHWLVSHEPIQTIFGHED